MVYWTGSDWQCTPRTSRAPACPVDSAEQEKMYRCVLDARNAIIAAMSRA
jgi:hypothetical protein